MHCDISGFTAMSEDLAGRGREGAELMVDVLNRFFGVMLTIAASFGGVQMKFGGDAMLLYFGGPGHANRTAACGLAMQKAMRPFDRVEAGGGTYSLRMRAGIHSGRFFSASAGDPGSVLHYVLTGPDVSHAAAVEAAAGLGQVACSTATTSLLQGATLGRQRDGIVRVLDAPADDITVRLPSLDAKLAERYLAPVLREGRTSGPGEHRRVSVVFINVLGVENLLAESDAQEVLDITSRYVTVLTRLLETHRGHLLGSDVAEHGDKFIALFGAPVADERQEAAAVRFALELQETITNEGVPLTQKIGVNTGYVFAGEVGSEKRREYTVIGDSVNLSARLMSAAAEGQVLVSATTGERAAREFDLRKLRPIRVKGKRDPVPIFAVGGSRTGTRTAALDTKIFGRDTELSVLLKAARAARRRGKLAYIWGEPGIGKSALTSAFLERMADSGWAIVRTSSQPHTSRTPFAPWQDVLPQLAAIEPGAAGESSDVANSLATGPPEGSDPRAFREAVVQGVLNVIQAAANGHPLVLIFEDAHWADDSSLGVLERLSASTPAGLLVCVTSRQPSRPELKVDVDLPLRELDREAARDLVTSSGSGDIDIDAVLEKSRGNPLFLTEFLRSGALSGDVPDTVGDLMMSRIDALAPDERQTLRVASVVGPRFAERTVVRLSEPMPVRRVRRALPSLVERGFTRLEAPKPAEYSFTHALLSDVAYQSAPFAFRRKLHLRAGELIEAEHAGEEAAVAALLLHHFERAGQAPKVVRYAAMAGARAAAVFSNREAADYYATALASLEKLPGNDADRSMLIERQADILELTGRHTEAGEEYADAFSAWTAGRQRPRGRYLPWKSGGREREAALCRKIAVARERAADYDDALDWLQRARKVAPDRGIRLRAELSATTCVTLFRKGEYAEAIAEGREAVRLAGRADDMKLKAYAHNMVANALIESGRLREAVRHLRPAVRLYHEMGDFAGQASSNNNLGSCYQLLGMYDAALYHYDVALRADERTGDEVDAAIVYNNTAETLLLLEREEEALSRLQQVLEIAERTPDLADLAAWAQVTTARCYRAMGNLAESSSHLQRGTRNLRRLEAHGLLGEALVDIAEQSLAEADYTAAATQARRALAHARTRGALLPEARARRVLGESLLARGRAAEGEAALRDALALSDRVDAGHEESRVRLALGRHYLASGRRGLARRLLARAHRDFRRAGARREADAAATLIEEASG
jgi:class 3 adenylate cyclase/tetratricopeptide (TPR) repeat protein